MDSLKLFFPPYKGSLYGKKEGFFNGIKVMAIGNSHHCDTFCDEQIRCGKQCSRYGEDCHNFTLDVVEDYMDDPHTTIWRDDDGKTHKRGWVRNFTKFSNLFNAPDEVEFWRSIAFYNFLQRAVPNEKAQGTSEEIQLSQKLVFKAIEECDPDVIIVWGRGNVFDNLPGSIPESGIEWIGTKESDKCGWYEINGKKIKVICTHHPQYYRYDENRELVESFAPELLGK